MKARAILLLFLVITGLIAAGQGPAMELTFTAVDNTTYVQLDSIRVMNRTQGGDTVLYWPDTVLAIYFVGIPEPEQQRSGFQVFQNYPNPVTEQTTISLYVPDKDNVSIIVTDMLGRVILKSDRLLDKGTHSFRFSPGEGNLYFFTAQWRGNISSIKILQRVLNYHGACTLEYSGSDASSFPFKAMGDIQSFLFSPGDELLCIGYANGLQSGMLDSPEESQTYTFQFATNIPCPGTPTVEYEGQVYNTIQVFSQCLLKENLNAGWMIPGVGQMTDNGFIEKFCFNDEPDSCAKYGGLYEWSEMMQYTIQEGGQGICPSGWHLPTDEEWKVLEGSADSQYGIGDPEWDRAWDYRGVDAGTNIKSSTGWYGGESGSDLFGVSLLPGGAHLNWGAFDKVGYYGHYWTSTPDYTGYAIYRYLDCYNVGIYRRNSNLDYGISVRCIRDEVFIDFIELTFTAINITSHVQLDSIKVMNRTQGVETMLLWPDTSLIVPYELPFENGDELLYIGYANSLESGILDRPEENKTCTFQFATNIRCPGTPTVEYEGQVYKTIQIFSQCWLKENLNVGMMIPGTMEQSNNGTIEKYCYNNEPDSCTKYGGLYQWDEMMQYAIQQGTQGICPPGWHIPTDEEWKVLEGAADSQYGIGDEEWEIDGFSRGFDAGTHLKAATDWLNNGTGTDWYGFTGMPSGDRNPNGNFYYIGYHNGWWTSTQYSEVNHHAWDRALFSEDDGVIRNSNGFRLFGFSVRCLRD